MNKEIITFGDIETEGQKFHHYKNPFFEQDPDTDNINI